MHCQTCGDLVPDSNQRCGSEFQDDHWKDDERLRCSISRKVLDYEHSVFDTESPIAEKDCVSLLVDDSLERCQCFKAAIK